MKKPIDKIIKTNKKDIVKLVESEHFCPICDKPTVKYYYECYKNGECGITEIDTDNAWWYIDPDECEITISKSGCIFIHRDHVSDDELINFNSKEYKKISKELLNISEMFNSLYDEYGKVYEREGKTAWEAEQLVPYFCSKECVKKFILSSTACMKTFNKQ